MSDWQLTAGLANLRGQVNARWPGRDKASDGTIGDAAHQAETSGHNPDDTSGAKAEWNGDSDSLAEVRAWDMDSDLREAGSTAQLVVDHLRKLPNLSSVLRYMIYNRKIYSASSGWVAQDYDGASAHTEHIHFSGAYTDAADKNTTFDYRLDEVGHVALTQDEYENIRDIVWGAKLGVPTYPDRTAGTALKDLSVARDQGSDPNKTIPKPIAGTPYAGILAMPPVVTSLVAMVTSLAQSVTSLQAQVAELAAKVMDVPATVVEVTQQTVVDGVKTAMREGVGPVQ